MAARPWVTPDEVRAYSEVKEVQSRSDERLIVDIARAEQYVITYTHNDFAAFKQVPRPVKTAVIILAEAYAHNTITAARTLKSESYDDYSYTADDSVVDVSGLDLAALLDDFVVTEPSGRVFMRLRRL